MSDPVRAQAEMLSVESATQDRKSVRKADPMSEKQAQEMELLSSVRTMLHRPSVRWLHPLELGKVQGSPLKRC